MSVVPVRDTTPGRVDPRSPDDRQRGSALLLVAASSAVLLTLAATLLAAALAAWQTAVLRSDAAQAGWLASAGLREAVDGLATGRILLPSGSSPVVVTGVLPDPPPGVEPLPAGAAPAPAGPPGGGCGFRVAVRTVRGPDGTPREVAFTGAPAGVGRLVELRGEGWCGRGHATRTARAVALPGSRVQVLTAAPVRW